MQSFFIQKLTEICQACNVSDVMSKSERDNITIKKPRIEYAFGSNTIKRSGKLLGVSSSQNVRTSKRELYTVEQNVQLTLYSNSKAFRDSFTHDFFYNLPRGVNDDFGNYVKFQYQEHDFQDEGDKRIGDSVIEVNKSYNATYNLLVTYRITETMTENFITNIHFNPEIKNKR